MVDFLNVVRGHIDTDAGLTDLIPIQGMPSSPHLDFAGEIRAATDFNVHAARIQDVATARHAIAGWQVDMVGMTRAHIADPHIVRKITAGQEEQIRPCVGANYCLDRIYQGGAATAFTIPHRAGALHTSRDCACGGEAQVRDRRRRTRGVGGRACRAERGHSVVVLEAASQPGGQVRLTARSRRRQEMIGIIDWRMHSARRRCAVRFDSPAEAEDVLAEKPDVVLVATGGYPHTQVLRRVTSSSCPPGTSFG